MSAMRMIAFGVLVLKELRHTERMDMIEEATKEMLDAHLIIKRTSHDGYQLSTRKPVGINAKKRRKKHILCFEGTFKEICLTATMHIDHTEKLNHVIEM